MARAMGGNSDGRQYYRANHCRFTYHLYAWYLCIDCNGFNIAATGFKKSIQALNQRPPALI